MFTRRHYCAVAAVIRDASYLEPDARGQLVSDFVALFARDNERFKSDRFRAATGDVINVGGSEPRPRGERWERDRLEARGYLDGHAAATWFAPQDEESARRHPSRS